jgi:hypothetical protein
MAKVANMATIAVLGIGLLLAGCDGGVQTLGWELDPIPTADRLPGDVYGRWFGGPAYYRRWSLGPPASAAFFPVGVWMQNPGNVDRFRAVGINQFVGLWQGPTDDQLAALAAAGMPTVCDPQVDWRSHLADTAIQSWLQPDGPDNAQLNPDGSYGPCIAPDNLHARYEALVTTDPTRPVTVSFGRGVIDYNWVGRGDCTGRIDMYADYARAADVLGFWVYPVDNHDPLEWMAAATDNLGLWSAYTKPIIAVVQASNIHGDVRPTPAQIAAQVWMAIVHGAAGIEYYCHQIDPAVNETDCLDAADGPATLTRIDAQIAALAPVLNTPPIANGVAVTSSAANVPVDVLVKRHGGATYLFAVAMRGAPTTATFTLRGLPGSRAVEVVGENRTLAAAGGVFSDDFAGYDAHVYRIAH